MADENAIGVPFSTLGQTLAGDTTQADMVDTILSGATLTTATVAGADKVVVQDTDDADNTKTVTAQSIADLAAVEAMTWSAVSTNTSMVANYGYITTGAIDMTLPTTASVGTPIRVLNVSGNCVISQNAGQTITFNTSTTTAGAGGSITPDANGQSLLLICTTEDTGWHVVSSMGATFTLV